jgi:3',5'-cyclic AMP phosphodiesterase CpdA
MVNQLAEFKDKGTTIKVVVGGTHYKVTVTHLGPDMVELSLTDGSGKRITMHPNNVVVLGPPW